jgi:hypothetical protein
VDWIRFAALVDHWPAAYGAFDCSQLDPADSDQRRIGLTAAHPELHEALDRDEDVEVDDAEVNPRLHLAAHEVIANQLIDGDPPEARTTATRLLAAGYDDHDVLHMLGSAVMDQVFGALTTGEHPDPEAYLDALDALPESWHEREPPLHYLDDEFGWQFRPFRDRIEATLRAGGLLEPKILAERVGLASDEDPRDLALYLLWHEDFAHVLPDGRAAYEHGVVDGMVLLHRPTPTELEVQRLDVSRLHLVLSVADDDRQIPLGAGGAAEWTIRRTVDGPERQPGDDDAGVFTLEGPPGWLDHVRSAEIIALSWSDGMLRIEPSAVDGQAADRAAAALAGAFADRAAADPDLVRFDQGATEVTEILLDVLALHPDLLRQPTAPVPELLERAGLSGRGDWVAAGDYAWDEHRRRTHENFLDVAVRDAGVHPDDAQAARRVIDRLERWLAGEPADRRDLARTGEELLVPGVALAAYYAHGRYDRDTQVATLLDLAQGVIDACSGRADGGAQYLAALCADRLGEGVRASRHVRAALAGGLDDPGLFALAVVYLVVGGDLARAARMLDMAAFEEEPDEGLIRMLMPFRERAGRNEPCPCGSGRKHKHCHGQPSGPPLDADERAVLVHFKATTLLGRLQGLWRYATLQRVGWDAEGDVDYTPIQFRLANDLMLFEGGGLQRVRDGWGPLFLPDEQRLLTAWLGTPITVTADTVTRHLPTDGGTWEPWEFPLAGHDRAALIAALMDADHLATADALAPLLRS